MDANRRDVVEQLRAWIEAGRPAVLATVVSSSGSAPRGLGAQLAIGGPSSWVGALSGGCTESAVLHEAEALLAPGRDERAGAYVAYGKATLADVGPVCGSTLGVVVERVDEELVEALEAVVARAMAGETVGLRCTWTWDGAAPGSVEDVEPGRVWSVARAELVVGEVPTDEVDAAAVELRLDGAALVAEHRVESSIHLVVGGGGDVARELLTLARRLAWRTTLVDPRRTIAEATVGAAPADELVVGWPDAVWEQIGVGPRSACVALAHESHVDEPFLVRALESGAAYVGAVGSRRVQAARREALAPLVDPADLQRLHGPAGLDLGGHAAAEIAVAIVAEVIAVTNGRGGLSLASTDGPIRAR